MGNQIINGRNHKKNIIKLSLNSISTNSIIQDNLSIYKEKDIKKFAIDKEKFIPNILYENDNKSINQTELNKKAKINSHNNKIICLSSYSMKINKPKEMENSLKSSKIYINNIKNNFYNRTKINYNGYNYNENRFKNCKILQNSSNEKNKLSHDNFLNKLNKDKDKDKNIIGKNKFLDLNMNKGLYEKIINEFGLIMSEYYPTFEPLKFRFPQRNRIVTGLSYGTLVVEASLKSGALISANLTLEQGRELMCVPGLITNPNTEGIYKLLKNGAGLITKPEDILEALNWEIVAEKPKQLNLCDMDEVEIKIFKSLEVEDKGLDMIATETGLDIDNLLSYLTIMELKGIIKTVEGDRYKRADI